MPKNLVLKVTGVSGIDGTVNLVFMAENGTPTFPAGSLKIAIIGGIVSPDGSQKNNKQT